MNRIFSQMIDNLYQKFTNDKTCSLLYENEIFDGVEYTNDGFFEYSKQYFSKPEDFYKKCENDNYVFELKLESKNNLYRLYSFETPFKTTFLENQNCYFKYFNNPNSDTLLIFSPGWARPNLKMEIWFCKTLLENNIDSILVTKPFHQERTPEGFYSGELFISANQLFTVGNFRQYVAELRNIINFYKDKYKKIGIIGMSSGGFQAGLMTTVEEVDFYFPFITGAKLGSITWNGTLTKFVKRDLQNKNISENDLNKNWAIADQIYLGKECKAKYIKQYISKFDQIVPTEYQYLLNEIYNNPSTYYINSAHTSVFFSLREIISDMVAVIKSL